MNYIIIDLEWNQPMKPDTLITDPVPLYGEIIRIGAVRTDENCGTADTFQVCVRPKFYRRIHYMVKKVTGLDSTALSYGLPFRDAFRQLMEFCGEDPVFIAWGSEDEKVLRANLAVHGIDDSSVPPFIDMQIIFSRRHTCDGRQYGVVPATELLGLPTDLQAHDALNDAIYTYRIGRKINFTHYIPDEYSVILSEIEEEKRIQREQRYFRTFYGVESVRTAMHSKKITTCRCPECKTKLWHTYFVFISERKAVAFAKCSTDGEFLVTLKFTPVAENKYDVTRSFAIPSPQQRDEYHAIIDEYTERKKAEKAQISEDAI